MFVDLRGKRCLVVGGGAVAARKTETLLRAGAQVHVVARELGSVCAAFLAEGKISARVGEYSALDLQDAFIAIAATDDPTLNQQLSRDAQAQRIFVNVVDQPALSTFIVPALIDRSPVIIAVSSEGAAPVLARTLRGKLEAFLPAVYGALAQLCAKLRADAKARLPTLAARRAFWEAALDSPAAELSVAGDAAAAEHAMRALLDAHAMQAATAPLPGEIACVGVGPGDPELISFRAQRAMLRAELIVHTADVPQAILELCRRDADRQRLHGALAEAFVASLPALSARARAGQRISLLARGDTFRTPEGERCVSAIRDAGLQCVVVPGISGD